MRTYINGDIDMRRSHFQNAVREETRYYWIAKPIQVFLSFWITNASIIRFINLKQTSSFGGIFIFQGKRNLLEIFLE